MHEAFLRSTNAFSFAATWHKGQTRKGIHREDFIQHPLRVAVRLVNHGLDDPNILSAALLHDVLEDTDCTPGLIQKKFGEPILQLVLEVTDDTTLLKSERKQRQVERAEYLSEPAGQIRLADKCDNVQSLIDDPPPNWGWPRQRAYVAWANRVVKRIPNPHPELLQDFQEISSQAWQIVTGTGL